MAASSQSGGFTGLEAVAEAALRQKGKHMASANLERALRREVRVQSDEGGGSNSRRTYVRTYVRT